VEISQNFVAFSEYMNFKYGESEAMPHLSPEFFPPGTLFSHFFLPSNISP
jgi:hypothetical protein